MTAIMRALAQDAGPKVLRIGLVQGGCIVEERIVKQRTSVTIGTGETSMFIVPGALAHYTLFERIGDDYWLHFRPEMRGRVALGATIHDLETLRAATSAERGRARGAERTEEGHRIRLTDDARGRIVVGETAILFQFVIAPPPQPRPQLPLSAKKELSQSIDWTLTIIAAFSFLMHFGFIGAIYSDWMDPVIDQNIPVRGLVDAAHVIVSATPAEIPADATSMSSAAPAKETARSASESAGHAKGRTKEDETAESDRKAAALAHEADALQLQWIATLGTGPAVAVALRQSEIPTVALDDAAKAPGGISNGTGLRIGAGTGAVIEPGKKGGLGQIAQTRGGDIGRNAGDEGKVQGPAVDVQILSTQAPSSVSDAESVVARLRPRFRNCYQRYGLSVDPGMSGAATITGKIAANGEVDAAEASDVSGLSPQVVTCLQRVVKDAQFTAPRTSSAQIRIPIKFVQQAR